VTSAATRYGREYTPRVLHSGFFQLVLYTLFIVCLLADIVCQVYSELTWWVTMRLVDVYAPHHLALPDEAETLYTLEIAVDLIGLEGFLLFSAFQSLH